MVIAFERDTRLALNDNGGLIIAQGTADKKIRFVGAQKTKGFWVGAMVSSGNNANVFENVEILHADSRAILSNVKAGLGTFGSGKAQMAFKNCRFFAERRLRPVRPGRQPAP